MRVVLFRLSWRARTSSVRYNGSLLLQEQEAADFSLYGRDADLTFPGSPEVLCLTAVGTRDDSRTLLAKDGLN